MDVTFCLRVCLIACVVGGLSCSLFTPVVETSYGKIRGLRSPMGQNLFYGITYASADRFQPPKEPERWDGIFYAVRRFGACAQTVSFLRFGAEDCLRLDVYVPENAKPTAKLPVLVFIHGGAYYYGSKIHYDPEFLVTKNVISVILNYRLGVFGFLCLNGVANLGLKDQVAALKWIQRNIAAFGGDPDNVTLSGQSAGASAAAMHMLSEKSKGLFHKLLLMSGSPLTPWSFNLEHRKAVYDDVRKLKRVDTEEDVYNYLANASLDDLLTITKDTSINPRYFKYTPCVDSEYADPFFKNTPYNLIKSGQFSKVPILSGITETEGILFYGLNNNETLKKLDDEFVERLPSVFSWCSKAEKKQIAKKLRSYFFGGKPIGDNLIENITNFYSDWLVNGTNDAFVDLIMQQSDQPLYSYVFSYDGGRNFAKTFLGSRAAALGATHTDDIFYVFKPAGTPMLLSNRDKRFIDRITTMFTNFMKFGNPTPFKSKLLPVQWPPFSNSTSVMRLDARLEVVSPSPTAHQLFYRDLLCIYGQQGHVPCESAQKCNAVR